MLRTTDEAYKRMVVEQQELDDRVMKLDKMVSDCRHHKKGDVSLDELHLLEEQLSAMMEYNSVLKIRIERVKGAEQCIE